MIYAPESGIRSFQLNAAQEAVLVYLFKLSMVSCAYLSAQSCAAYVVWCSIRHEELKIRTLQATLSCAWRYRVSVRAGLGLSVLRLGMTSFDLQLLSQCGSMYSCLSRAVPAVHWHVAVTSSKQATNVICLRPLGWTLPVGWKWAVRDHFANEDSLNSASPESAGCADKCVVEVISNCTPVKSLCQRAVLKTLETLRFVKCHRRVRINLCL